MYFGILTHADFEWTGGFERRIEDFTINVVSTFKLQRRELAQVILDLVLEIKPETQRLLVALICLLKNLEATKIETYLMLVMANPDIPVATPPCSLNFASGPL